MARTTRKEKYARIGDPLRIKNHVIDPKTGLLDSPAFEDAFNPPKKKLFIQTLRDSGFQFGNVCTQLKVKAETVFKHLRIDQEFKRQMNAMIDDYSQSLEWVSRTNAMNPKSVIERIFQLKAFFPHKYDRGTASDPNIQINLNIDTKILENLKTREKSIDAELVYPPQISTTENITNINDNQQLPA